MPQDSPKDSRKRVLVPLAFQREFPALTHVIHATCRTQIDADKYIRRMWPDYIGDYDPDSRSARRARDRNRRWQAASSYSLDHCQGGGAYHVADKRVEVRAWHTPSLKATVDVCESLAHPDVPVSPKLYPKTYLSHPHTGEPRTVRTHRNAG